MKQDDFQAAQDFSYKSDVQKHSSQTGKSVVKLFSIILAMVAVKVFAYHYKTPLNMLDD